MTPTALMGVSSAPRCLSPAWEHAMRRLHRSCLSHSSVAIFEMFGRFGAIHNQTTPVGAQAMAGGFLTLIRVCVCLWSSSRIVGKREVIRFLPVCPSSGQNGTGTRPVGKHAEEKQRYNSCGSPGRRTFPHG